MIGVFCLAGSPLDDVIIGAGPTSVAFSIRAGSTERADGMVAMPLAFATFGGSIAGEGKVLATDSGTGADPLPLPEVDGADRFATLAGNAVSLIGTGTDAC